MALVSRSYSQPDVIRTVWSTETVTYGTPYAPFSHTEVAQRIRGRYEGVTTPGWRRSISRGDIVPFQPYTRYDEVSSQSGHRWLTWNVGGVPTRYRMSTIASCGIFEDFSLFPSETELSGYASKYSMRAEGLLQDAASNIADDWDPLTFAAEIHQVKGMFLSLGPRMIAQLLSKPPQKAAADVWLQWQFGWKPLFSDLEAMRKLINSPNQAGRHKKSKTKVFTDTNLIDLSKVLPNGETHRVTGSNSVNVNIRATAIADLSAFTSNLYINPISTAWELVPYSFVIDYFFNVGNWIKANSVMLASSKYTACIGYDITLHREVYLSGTRGGSLSAYSASGNAVADARLRLRVPRTLNLGNLPPVKLDLLSVTRLINLVALALQKVR